MPTTQTLQTLAAEALRHFTTGTRDGGETFTKTTDDAPDWLQPLCLAAHGTMMPDDYRYEMIRNALDAIAESDEDADMGDVGSEFADEEPSIWNTKRAQWLASSLDRAGYVDEAVSEFGAPEPFDLFKLLGMGWYIEAREVFESVRSSLADRLEEIEAEADDEEEADAE